MSCPSPFSSTLKRPRPPMSNGVNPLKRLKNENNEESSTLLKHSDSSDSFNGQDSTKTLTLKDFKNQKLTNGSDFSKYWSLAHKLKEWLKQARENPPSKTNPDPSWTGEIEKEVNSKEWETPYARLALLKQEQDLKELREKYEKKVFLMEEIDRHKKMEALSGGKNTVEDYSGLVSDTAFHEAQLTDMDSASSKVVFVGSGSDPLSVKEYSKHALEVVGLDIDLDAITATKHIAKASNGKIRFEHIDGNNYDYQNATHIGLAVMTPRREILKRIAETASPGTLITVRGAIGLGKALYAPFQEGDWPDTLEHLATLRLGGVGQISVLRKKPDEDGFPLRKVTSLPPKVAEIHKEGVPFSKEPVPLSRAGWRKEWTILSTKVTQFLTSIIKQKAQTALNNDIKLRKIKSLSTIDGSNKEPVIFKIDS